MIVKLIRANPEMWYAEVINNDFEVYEDDRFPDIYFVNPAMMILKKDTIKIKRQEEQFSFN